MNQVNKSSLSGSYFNPINKNGNKCFQYAVTIALNYEEIKKDAKRISKIQPSISKYNWEGINYPLGKFQCFVCQKGKNISCLCFKT